MAEELLLGINEWLDLHGIDRAYKKDMRETYNNLKPDLQAQIAKVQRLGMGKADGEVIARQLTIFIYGDVAEWDDLTPKGKELMLVKADQVLALMPAQVTIDRAELRKALIEAIKDYTRYQIGTYNDKLEREWAPMTPDMLADQIIAFRPTEEEIRKAERKAVFQEIEVEYSELKTYWGKKWQALKEE